MVLLVMGLALFIGVHLVTTQPDLRHGLSQRMGLGAYKGLSHCCPLPASP